MLPFPREHAQLKVGLPVLRLERCSVDLLSGPLHSETASDCLGKWAWNRIAGMALFSPQPETSFLLVLRFGF